MEGSSPRAVKAMHKREVGSLGRILVGTCAWSDHENFYPAGLAPSDRIRYYAEHFPLVEVDSTYYHMPSERNFRLWSERTPPGFRFDVKAYRAMTRHDRDGAGRARPVPGDRGAAPPGGRRSGGGPARVGYRAPAEAELPLEEVFARFASAIAPMREAGKLRAVLLQFPPWFVCRESNLDYLLFARRLLPDFTLAVEFRHRSWFAEDQGPRTLRFLERHGFVHVVADEPQVGDGCVPAVQAVTHPDLAIVRLHGRNAETWYIRGTSSGERFRYRYGPAELEEWARAAERLAAQAREVHVLFNNNFGDYAVMNAAELRDLLGVGTGSGT